MNSRNRLASALLALSILCGGSMLLVTCGDSGGPALPGILSDLAGTGGNLAGTPGDGGGGGGGDMSCRGIPGGDCGACLSANCNAELIACFGNMWQSMDLPTSVCAGLFACTCECEAMGSKDCSATCAEKRGAKCVDCVAVAQACLDKSCKARCM